MKHRQNHDHSDHPSPRLRWWATLVATPLAAALALVLWAPTKANQQEPAGRSPAQHVSHSPSRHPAAARAPLAYQWKTGELLTYKVRSYTAVRIEEEGWEHTGPANAIEITGLCSYRILRIEDDQVTMAAQMSETRVHGDERNHAVLEELLNTRPVVLRFDTRGRRLACLLPPDLPTGDREILAGMHEHQLVLPENRRQSAWTTLENGRAGEFECTHTVTRNGSIEKRRDMPSQDQSAACQVLKSDIVATIGTTWIEVLDAHESFAISNGEKRLGAAESDFHMSLSATTVEPEGLDRLFADHGLAATFTPQSDAGAEGPSALERQSFQTLEDRLAAVPLELVFDHLRTVAETAESHEATIEAIHALRDWLLVHPEGAFALADALADPSLPTAFTARAIHALELAAKRPEAQQALAEILQRPEEFSRQAMLQAVIAAGGVGSLRPELHAALSETVNRGGSTSDFSVSDAALYALGNLAQTNPQVAEQLAGALLPDLSPSNHARTTHTALNALANGRLATPEIVQQATALAQSHAGPEVRAAAVHYLSRLPETAPDLLISFLRDPAEQVQLEAIESLAIRKSEHPELSAPLEQHLASSTSDLITVRLQEILEK